MCCLSLANYAISLLQKCSVFRRIFIKAKLNSKQRVQHIEEEVKIGKRVLFFFFFFLLRRLGPACLVSLSLCSPAAIGRLNNSTFESFMKTVEEKFMPIIEETYIHNSWSLPFCQVLCDLFTSKINHPLADFEDSMKELFYSILDGNSSLGLSSTTTRASFTGGIGNGSLYIPPLFLISHPIPARIYFFQRAIVVGGGVGYKSTYA